MKLLKTFPFICFLLCASQLWARDYQASMFGIKNDGITLNTRSIQKAIDYIHENGGGKLRFLVGRYLSGSIHLKSNVTLDICEGAVLVGSTNPYDYDKVLGWESLIFANEQDSIAITGKGIIDGQGRELSYNLIEQIRNGVVKDELKLDRPANRPKLVYFRSCSNVSIKNVTMKNPAFWTQTYDQCKNLKIDSITVHSRAMWNNDGMDIVDCNGAIISNCFVDATDDGICLKSHDSNSICQNVEIRNCTVCSSASGIKFGTASRGGFRNVKIINNTVFDTYRSAIALEAVDGGVIDNIVVDSLRSINTGNVFYLTVGERMEGRKGILENVHISNVYAEVPSSKPDAGYEYEGPTEDMPRNISPAVIVGMPDVKIKNVTFTNIEINYPGGGNPFLAKVGLDELDKIPELTKNYPEFSIFKELPAWGFYIRHAEGISFKGVTLSIKKKDYRPAIVLDDVHNSSFTAVKVNDPDKKKETIYPYKSSNINK